MSQTTIPAQWRAPVCATLKTEATGSLIQWTFDATSRFEAHYLEAWPYELYQAFRSYLEGHEPVGCLKMMATPAGETYEFFFTFSGEKTYGKIMLRDDLKTIVIFSAHPPLQDKLSCE
jgi:hypothetical protein